jgi:Ca2+-binding EF-hand superfamily protein
LLAALCCLPPPRGAADPPAAPAASGDPGWGDDVQDVIFLTDARPFVFRLHITIDGQPFAARWNEHLRKVFKFLDADGDGFLSKDEASAAPSPAQMNQLFHGVPYTSVSSNDPSMFEEMDADADKKVSPDEFVAYYRKNNAGPLQLQAGVGRGAGANALTDVLFKALDTDGDGKLSREELLVAEEVLHKYDENDDELISAQELLPSAPPLGMNAPVVMPAQPQRPPPPPADSPLFLVPKEEGPKRTTQRLKVAADLVARYDKNKDGKLSPDEIGVPRDVFDQFDADKDGFWEAKELLRWMIFKPDVEAVLRLGDVPTKEALLDLSQPPAAGVKSGTPLRKAAANTASMSMEDVQINLIREEAASPNYDNVKEGYLQQFEAADVNNRGYITPKDVEGGKNTTLYALFDIADRQRIKRLAKKDVEEWAALASGGAGRSATLTLTDNGRALFEMLDADNDGRLSVRELRSAWARLSAYDRDGDGKLARTEVPRQFQVVVGQGPPTAAGPQDRNMPMIQQPQAPPRPPAKPARGPAWFRKMDVNGDGDVSRREFLGSKEDFDRIDTDHDGIITLEEAEAFDAKMREKSGEK